MPKRYKVLITGSSGMLGADLSSELGKYYEVYGLDISVGVDAERCLECDITDGDKISERISKIKPEIVVHAAAMTDVDGCESDKEKAYKINSEGTGNVAAACKESGAALIYISTDFVFDGKKSSPYVESDKPNPLSVYADSKLKGEEAVAKFLKNYFILRTGWLYGKHGKNFVDTILEKAKTGKALKVVDDQIGSPTYTKDLAKAIRVLIDQEYSNQVRSVRLTTRSNLVRIYHVSNSGSVSWYEYAKEILRLAGSGAEVVPISSGELNRPARRPAMSVLDNSKFIRFTGYKMRNWKDALKEYIGG
ncbi:MAG: dTDP-4-dehydrorhamnose reductase [Candidatus Omnitrophota bacterium]